jgi:hypothetical protein
MSTAEPDPSPDSAAWSPGQEVRRLLRSSDRAALATRMTAYGPANGWPYGSLVLLAVDQTAAPLLLISDLAEHTKNIDADSRVALLVDGTAGLADPLTGARASVLGRAVPCDDSAARGRYLARHPSAAMYAGFKDFHLLRVEISAAHLVAGFGRIDWVGADDILDRAAPALADAEAEIVAHMNRDHADALDLMARTAGFGAGLDGQGWRMTGIDPEGIDLRRAGAIARIDFGTRVEDAGAARAELVRLARAARDAASVP